MPFRCVYRDGELQKFERETDDVLGSLNIKRALAAMFQLKLDSLGRSSFVAQEVNGRNFVLPRFEIYTLYHFLNYVTDRRLREMRRPVHSYKRK